jgi:hypothetical protein
MRRNFITPLDRQVPPAPSTPPAPAPVPPALSTPLDSINQADLAAINPAESLASPAPAVQPLVPQAPSMSFQPPAAVAKPAKRRKVIILVAGLVVIIGLPLAYLMLHTNPSSTGPTSKSVNYPANKAVTWAVLPTKLPAGLTDLEACRNASGSFNLNCEFSFTTFPGYLSPAGQKQVVAYQASTGGGPETGLPGRALIGMDIIENDSAFEPYLAHNGSCDIKNLKYVATAAPGKERKKAVKDYAAKPKACAKQTTPGGTALYQQTVTANGIAQPGQYYFIKDKVLVILDHNQVLGGDAKLLSIYLNDANYRPEFQAFVDSFTRNK